MPDHDHGLSDVLREMAGGGDVAPQADHLHEFDDQMDESLQPAVTKPRQSRSRRQAPTAAAQRPSSAKPTRRQPARQPAASPRVPRRASGQEGIKATAVPVLTTLGMILLGMGVWAVLVLIDADVWWADRPDASKMAMAMLVCWPIAISLLAAAGVFFGQITKERKRAQIMRANASR